MRGTIITEVYVEKLWRNKKFSDTRMGERNAIDRVIATQPELGPSIPDGGYGWFVVLGSAFFQVSK